MNPPKCTEYDYINFDPNDAFLREPYFATFRAGLFDFTAIAVHVIWGDSVNGRRREVHRRCKPRTT